MCKEVFDQKGKIEMEQYPTKDLTIDPQVAEEAIKRFST